MIATQFNPMRSARILPFCQRATKTSVTNALSQNGSKMTAFEQKIHEKFSISKIANDVFRPNIVADACRQQFPKIGYGGLLSAQALASADLTVPSDSKAHSLNNYFFLPVDTDQEISLSVSRLRDSSSFNTRIIEAHQNDQLVYTAIASYHSGNKPSAIHQSKAPNVPEPNEFRDLGIELSEALQKHQNGERTLSKSITRRMVDYDLRVQTHPDSIIEMRAVDLDRYLGLKIVEPPVKDYFWLKTRTPLSSDDQKLHRWILTYGIDNMCPDSALRPHFGLEFMLSFVGTISYNLKYHRSFRADEWMLLEFESDTSVDSRLFTRGRVWQNQQIIASFDSEIIARTKGTPSKI
ncbi:hypothetical protein WR25_27287 [Diploscapter pachys]|uniref:Acyl-CoA thioesterase II domain-containing protein n=1 Tax=Diploscapter pachys TaxID=2018661 RepID=A0A2A2JHT1_9BILA|nr:hypothetical protein WR25_27287 [Diploscapter pachys]